MEPRVVTPEHERRIADAAHNLLDLCLASADAGAPKGAALSLAVQAIFMTDHLKVGVPIAERGQRVSMEEVADNMTGLGMGAGACLGSLPDAHARMAMTVVFITALQRSVDDRSAMTARMMREAKR